MQEPWAEGCASCQSPLGAWYRAPSAPRREAVRTMTSPQSPRLLWFAKPLPIAWPHAPGPSPLFRSGTLPLLGYQLGRAPCEDVRAQRQTVHA